MYAKVIGYPHVVPIRFLKIGILGQKCRPPKHKHTYAYNFDNNLHRRMWKALKWPQIVMHAKKEVYPWFTFSVSGLLHGNLIPLVENLW
jgi:hypothetical protein